MEETRLTDDDIAELITRRRRQVLVHSVMYYELDENIISDTAWDEWAAELAKLQYEHPEIAKNCPMADYFDDFDGSSGAFLPLDDTWAINKARQLLKWRTIKDD